ncbi:MAG: DegT/DnrJ/EryC1/StrS family aminotransferase [Magnetococcales bacterium]|nr:DegT/DnrJ/EryC1/StrS family aminotransferase [Magnetococcales bacterium]
MTDTPMQIPFNALDRQFQQHREAFLGITERVLSGGRVLQGPEVGQFETDVARLCDRREGIAVGSCTDALGFALMACGIGPGDEVLVTGLSFIASLSPILRVGARPRFVDVDPAYGMMNLDLLESLVTPKTRAILAVHLYGQTLDMERVEAFARKHHLALIEDAAQALGAGDNGRPAGSMGDVSCLSFDPTKVIGSFSSAGAVVTDNSEIARIIRQLRYHGREPSTRAYEMPGYNSQLSSQMAGMLSYKLGHLEAWNHRRNELAGLYLDGLKGLKGVTLPAIRPGSSHNWHKFVLQVDDRDALKAALAKARIQSMIHYPRPLSDEPMTRILDLPVQATRVEETRRLCSRVLSLPIFPEMTDAEAAYVVEIVRSHYGHH